MAAASQMGGGLPEALQIGRSSVAGPQTGGYLSFGLAGYNSAVFSLTDAIIFAIEMPMDFRVEAIAWSARSTVVTASFQVAKASTLAWGGSETDLMSADIPLVTTGSELVVAAGSTPTLVAAARDIDRGEFLMIGYTSDADATAVDLSVQIIGFARGHINIDPADD